jgi:hypothetical protein
MSFNATTKQVTAAIRKIDGKALRNHIQTAAVHVIGHAMQYGHSPLANALADQMQLIPMTRKLAPMVISFLTKNGPFNYGKDTGFVFAKSKRDAMNEDGYDFEAFVLTCPQWDEQAKADKKDATLDLVKAVEALVGKAEKKSIDGHVVDAELIPFLKALLGQYAGKKILAKAAADAKAAAEAAKETTIENGDAGTALVESVAG